MQNEKSWILEHPEKIETMATKMAALIFSSLNIFLFIFAWIANFDNIKSTILFIVALCMSIYRFYRWAVNSMQNKRLKDLAIREKEIELMERQQKIK